ncbi:MAG: hypothetical protein H0T57_11535 [Rubrobacter sp.]|nr:hypothetical protein [Rubrobacter sp.]
MAKFCQNCGGPLQASQSQPGPVYPPQSPPRIYASSTTVRP